MTSTKPRSRVKQEAPEPHPQEGTLSTLEKISTELSGGKTLTEDDLTRIHTASLLSFFEAASGTVNATTMPTPLYRLAFDDKTHTLNFAILDGDARVPQKGTLDLSLSDMIVASQLKDRLPILIEGITGVGKTYTAEQVLRTVLPRDNFHTVRLSRNMSNVLQPFIAGKVENGLVEIALRENQLDRTASILFDEANRADSNHMLMLQDGEVRLSTGEGGKLGPLIPVYENGQWTFKGRKLAAVISAQNPSSSKDAKYTATRPTDAAQNNRNLTVDMPNSAASIGSSLYLLERQDGQHAEYLRRFADRLAQLLNIGPLDHEQFAKDYISLFAFTTNPARNRNGIMSSASEFLNSMLVLTAPDVQKEYQKDIDVARDWDNALKPYGITFSYSGALDPQAAILDTIRGIVGSFEEQVVPRDTDKVDKLADSISTIRRIRASIGTTDSLETFLRTRNAITIEDVASALAIMLWDKQVSHDHNSTALVSETAKEYANLASMFMQAKKIGGNFGKDNPQGGIYVPSIADACREGCSSNGGAESKMTRFIKSLSQSANILSRLDQGVELRKPMIARFNADLATLAGFVDQYGLENGSPFQEGKMPVGEAYQRMQGMMLDRVTDGSTPPIYLHRLRRVLGV